MKPSTVLARLPSCLPSRSQLALGCLVLMSTVSGCWTTSTWAAPKDSSAADGSPPLSQERLTCVIEARMKVKVSASVQGLVERVLVDRGDRVKTGQPLVEMESSVEKAQLAMAAARATNIESIASATAKLDAAQRALDRYQRLRKASPGALTEVKYDEAEMESRVAEANLRDARHNLETAELEHARAKSVLELRTIRSPVDGVVTERVMSPGEYRNEQAYFVTIAAIDPLYVEVFMPVAFYSQVHVGGEAMVFPAAPIRGNRIARVTVVDPVIDAPSGTFGVRLELPNPDYAIPAGLRCEIQFPVIKTGAGLN